MRVVVVARRTPARPGENDHMEAGARRAKLSPGIKRARARFCFSRCDHKEKSAPKRGFFD
jgi:hypothetical protein